jgi:hypothetical protein
MSDEYLPPRTWFERVNYYQAKAEIARKYAPHRLVHTTGHEDRSQWAGETCAVEHSLQEGARKWTA